MDLYTFTFIFIVAINDIVMTYDHVANTKAKKDKRKTRSAVQTVDTYTHRCSLTRCDSGGHVTVMQ